MSLRKPESETPTTDPTNPNPVCLFCDSTFPAQNPACITSTSELIRLSGIFKQVFNISKCYIDVTEVGEDKDEQNSKGVISPFCPTCTKLVKLLDTSYTKLNSIRDTLAQSAVNSYVYASRDSPHFKTKHLIFQEWFEKVQKKPSNGISVPVPANSILTTEESETDNEKNSKPTNVPEVRRLDVDVAEDVLPKVPLISRPGPLSKKKVQPSLQNGHSSLAGDNNQGKTKNPEPSKVFALATEVLPSRPGPLSKKRISVQSGLNEDSPNSPSPLVRYSDNHETPEPIKPSQAVPVPVPLQKAGPLSKKRTQPSSIGNPTLDNHAHAKNPEPNTEPAKLPIKVAQLAPVPLQKPGPLSKKRKLNEPPQIVNLDVPTSGVNLMESEPNKTRPGPANPIPAPKPAKIIKSCLSEQEKLGTLASMMFRNLKSKTKKTDVEPSTQIIEIEIESDDPAESEDEDDDVCKVCYKVCRSKELLQVHMKVHEDPVKHKCTHCEKTYFNLSSLAKHKSKHDQNTSPVKKPNTPKKSDTATVLDFGSGDIDDDDVPERVRAGFCKICHRHLRTKKNLARHLRKAHPKTQSEFPAAQIEMEMEPIPANPPEIPRPSPSTSRMTIEITQINPAPNPDKSTEKLTVYKCPECPPKGQMIFRRLRNYKSHFNKVHNGVAYKDPIQIVRDMIRNFAAAPVRARAGDQNQDQDVEEFKEKNPEYAGINFNMVVRVPNCGRRGLARVLKLGHGDAPDAVTGKSDVEKVAVEQPSKDTNSNPLLGRMNYWDDPGKIISSSPLVTSPNVPSSPKKQPKPVQIAKKQSSKKPVPSQIVKVNRLAKNLRATGIFAQKPGPGTSVKGTAAEFHPKDSLIPLGFRNGPKPKKTPNAHPNRNLSLSPPPLYVSNGDESQEQDDEYFDPAMFVEVGTQEEPEITGLKTPFTSRIPDGMKIVPIQDIVQGFESGSSADKITGSEVQAIQAPASIEEENEYEDCSIRIRSFRSLLETEDAEEEEDDDDIEIIGSVQRSLDPNLIPPDTKYQQNTTGPGINTNNATVRHLPGVGFVSSNHNQNTRYTTPVQPYRNLLTQNVNMKTQDARIVVPDPNPLNRNQSNLRSVMLPPAVRMGRWPRSSFRPRLPLGWAATGTSVAPGPALPISVVPNFQELYNMVNSATNNE